MRKLIGIFTGTLILTCFTITMFAQMLQIQSMSGTEVCQGYTSANQAQMQVLSGLPATKPANTYVTYVWTSTHANGTKTWDTNQPTRRVPIPWAGEYTVQVVAHYIREGESRPYAAFWSNRVKVMGMICKP